MYIYEFYISKLQCRRTWLVVKAMGSPHLKNCFSRGTSSLWNGSVCTEWEPASITWGIPASSTPLCSVSPTPRRWQTTCSPKSIAVHVSDLLQYQSDVSPKFFCLPSCRCGLCWCFLIHRCQCERHQKKSRTCLHAASYGVVQVSGRRQIAWWHAVFFMWCHIAEPESISELLWLYCTRFQVISPASAWSV